MLAIDDLYGGTNRMLRRIAAPQGLTYDFCSTANIDSFVAKMRPNTRIVWLESPTNPLLQVGGSNERRKCFLQQQQPPPKVTDIRAICSKVKAANPQCLVVVDNTFMSAYFQRPLELGADIEFDSVTKYYNGRWTMNRLSLTATPASPSKVTVTC